MKNLFKKIALTLTLILSFNTIPAFANSNNTKENQISKIEKQEPHSEKIMVLFIKLIKH